MTTVAFERSSVFEVAGLAESRFGATTRRARMMVWEMAGEFGPEVSLNAFTLLVDHSAVDWSMAS